MPPRPSAGYPAARERPTAARVALPYWRDEMRLGERYSGLVGVTASAAQFPSAQLFNPAHSGKVLIVDRVILASTTGGAITLEITETALDTLVDQWFALEGRHQQGRGELRGRDGATLNGDNMVRFQLLANTMETIDTYGLELIPGWGLHAQNFTAAGHVAATFVGREYPLP